MTATIGFVSGFLVADDSMLAAYQESFEKYHIEDGNFTLEKKATDSQIKRLEKEGVQIYENYYVEEDADTDLDGEKDSTVRVYKNRSQIDLVCLMKGELPKKEDEIAIDRMYAENNKIQISDIIKVGKEEKTVTGYVALSDYSALFSNNSDMRFDAVKFGVAIVQMKPLTIWKKRTLNIVIPGYMMIRHREKKQRKKVPMTFLRYWQITHR